MNLASLNYFHFSPRFTLSPHPPFKFVSPTPKSTCIPPSKLNRISLCYSAIIRKQFKVGSTPFLASSVTFGNPFNHRRNFGLPVKAEKDGEMDKAEEEARGQSTMPDRFRHLTTEVPDQPVRWPWFIALAFGLYAWRTVLWELSNWKKAGLAIVRFLAYISKLALALLYQFIGDPITSLIRSCETTFYTIRASYSWIINYAPVEELMIIITLSSAVLAISEATVPDSVNSQPYLLTVAGLVGFAAVRSYITELFFWTLLFGLFSFARFAKKKDDVSSAMPVVAVLVAVGEPWIRILVLSLFLGLAIYQHSNQPSIKNEDKGAGIVRKVPVPILCAALAIAVRIGAKWAGYRHLTWMIV